MSPSRRFLEARFHRVDTPIAMASLCPQPIRAVTPRDRRHSEASLPFRGPVPDRPEYVADIVDRWDLRPQLSRSRLSLEVP